jgi:FixJ family two-component response regulator
MEAGAVGFLAKPFREGDLLDRVRSALRSEHAM